jgi:hypothetical protein
MKDLLPFTIGNMTGLGQCGGRPLVYLPKA